jgi:DNA replication protein DnaC
MHNQTTLTQLRAMKLFGLATAFQTSMESRTSERVTPDEWLASLVAAEWEYRQSQPLRRSLLQARFRYTASLADVDHQSNRNLESNHWQRLSDCHFIARKENLIITGATGVGKSFLASALGHQACVQGYKVLYQSTAKLLSRLKMAQADNSYNRELARIEKQDLLILDDFGLTPIDKASRYILLELMEDRHGKRATLVATQLPVSSWYELIGEQTVADAIMDRLVHAAHRIELNGESLRKKQKVVSVE